MSKNNLDRVVFLGGNPLRASVRIRCIQIAKFLNCKYITNCQNLSQVPADKDIFICVKVELSSKELNILSKRGVIIWDVQDFSPSNNNVSLYLTSSNHACQTVTKLGNSIVIPQHHCNFTNIPNIDNGNRDVYWIGRPYWCPDFNINAINILNSNKMNFEEVVNAYRRMGICLNIRAKKDGYRNHITLNDGGKLLNCIGFGIPSISEREPAYLEYGKECTIFSNEKDVKKNIKKLMHDVELYKKIRENCIINAKQFSIQEVSKLYIRMTNKY